MILLCFCAGVAFFVAGGVGAAGLATGAGLAMGAATALGLGLPPNRETKALRRFTLNGATDGAAEG